VQDVNDLMQRLIDVRAGVEESFTQNIDQRSRCSSYRGTLWIFTV